MGNPVENSVLLWRRKMKEKKSQTGEKCYRVVQNEGKISWRIEELWDGGVVRGPFGAKEFAIREEEEIARTEGFIDDLVLKEEAVAREKSPCEAFEKDAEGKWRCIEPVSFEIENSMIVISEGMTFTKGSLHMLVDVAKWLDENCP
jgi:hypothetical protein